ncbi:stAR-related lipid transfer protein 9 isoform X3 [Zootoca vivipara]|nr:stAR-related lipid transfer protein 9 isoform X3 [Zootoca vivipara]
MFSSCQSINSIGSEVDSSPTDNNSGASISSQRRQAYTPYRDSILTWLLKDSLGGNSKTIMIATISPANSCYNETMSTLRYASNAKNIINKPRVNEDANVKLIRELREEIDRLKAMLMSFELRNYSPSWSDDREGNLTELVLQNELKIEQLTKDWTDKWINRKAIMEEYSVDINKEKAGVMIDSSLPHLMAMDYDILSTGVMLYHLREGTTKIGRSDSNQEQDIVLQGQCIERDHCIVDNQHGIVTLRPLQGAHCVVNGHEVTGSVRLSQGALVILGKAYKFRFNHPAEAAVLRQRRSISESSSVVSCRSLEWLDLDGDFPSLPHSFYPAETESSEQRDAVHEECQPKLKNQEVLHSKEIQKQQQYVEKLQQQILDGQIKAEQELEHDQVIINQWIKENQQWLIDEKKRLAVQQQQQESAVQTEVKSYAEAGVQNVLESETGLSLTEQNKKKLVQLELLRKYSLKKAERHLSRKKVKVHLDRIVKKQKLLEAKKNLEHLEANCWINEDNVKYSLSLDQNTTVASGDFKCSQPQSDSCSLQCRRNSFLNHQPTHCSFFVKRDPSQVPTSAHSHGCCEVNQPRKSLTVEYPPRTIKELSRRDNIHDDRDYACPTNRQQIKIQKSLYLGSKGRVNHDSSNAAVISLIYEDNETMEKSDRRPRQTRSKTEISKTSSPDHFKKKSESETGRQVGKLKAPADSNQHKGKHLEKSGTQEASRKTRTDIRKKHKTSLPGNSSMELKKSAIYGELPEKHLSQTANNVKRHSKDKQSEEELELLRLATSARSLNNINAPTPLCHEGEKWHSAEVLSDGISKAVPKPLRSLQEDDDIEFSDTDSAYSVDSLSSASANILRSQLSHTESSGIKDTVELEGSESDDSQMSQDSLSGKVKKTESQDTINFLEVHQEPVNNCQSASLLANTPLSNHNWTMNERSFSLDSLGDVDEVPGEDIAEESKLESFDEVPAEAFWNLQNPRSKSIKSNKQQNHEICKESVKRPNDLNLNTDSFYLDASTQSSSSSIYDQSVKEMEICVSGTESSFDQQSNAAGENLPVFPDAWLSCDSKNGKASPIITMPSSQDHSEFRVAQLHPINKSNCWMKKDDLRQSAAELSFVSCYKKPYWVSHEPDMIETLFSPSVPFPETRKHLEIEAPGDMPPFSLSTKNVQFGHGSTKYGYSEVASPPESNCQQPDELSEGGSATIQKEDIYVNTNFKECLFRTIEKEDFDCDSNSNIRDSEVVDLNLIDKSTCTVPSGSPDLIALGKAQKKYQGHEHLFSKEGVNLFSDESFFLCDALSESTNNVGEEEYSSDNIYLLRHCGSNFDLVPKTRYQQVAAEEIVRENKLCQSKKTDFCHSDQFSLPIQISETERFSVQEKRDAVTESALEVPSFREVEEEAQEKDLCSESNCEIQTKLLTSDSHSGSELDYSGSRVSQNVLLTSDAENMMEQTSEGGKTMLSFSGQGTSSSTSMDLVTDKSMCSNMDKNGGETKLSVDSDKSTFQSNSNVHYQDTAGMGKYAGKCQGSMALKDVHLTKSSSVENNVNDPNSVGITDQKFTVQQEVEDTFLLGPSVQSGKTKAWHIPASRGGKEATVFHVDFSENDGPGMEVNSKQARNNNEKDCGGMLGNDGIESVTAVQEQNLCIGKESEHPKNGVDTGALTTSEDNKCELNSKTINSEELIKLMNSVNKLECDISEIKYSQRLHNYHRGEFQWETVESRVNSENVSLVQSTSEEHYRKLAATVTHEETNIQLIDENKGEPCPTKPAMEPDSIIHSSSVNENKIHETVKQSDCLEDIEANSKCSVPTIVTQNITDLLDECEKPVQVDRILENVPSFEPSATAITTECRQEDALTYSEDDKYIYTDNEASVIESLLMYPKTVLQENEVNGDVICSETVSKEHCDTTENVNSRLTELHTDGNVVLQQENPGHGFINCDNTNNGTNSEIPEIYFTSSNLEEEQDVHQITEVCLDVIKTQQHEKPPGLWTYTGIINETPEDNSNGCASDNRAVIGQCGISEEFKQTDSGENINGSKCLSTNSHGNISEHCDTNFGGSICDDKFMPVNCIPKEKETTHPTHPLPLATAKKLDQSTNIQNVYILKTQKVGGNFEENRESLEVDGSQNQARFLLENKCSYWFSNNDSMLSDLSEEKKRLPLIFSGNEIFDDSMPINQTGPLEHRNHNYGLTSAPAEDLCNQSAYSSLLPGISTDEENMKGDHTIISNPEMLLSNSINNEVVLQYYETQMDSDLQARMSHTFNKGGGNDSLSDIVMNNKCITFPPDQLGQDGQGKGDFISNKMSNYTAPEQNPSKDDTFSKPYIAECHASLVSASTDDPQNKASPLQTLFPSESTSDDADRFRGEYSTKEEENCLNSLSTSHKETATSDSLTSDKTTTYPSSGFRENVEEATPLLPELSSHESFNSNVSQKDLNSPVPYEQTNKSLGTDCIKTECRINSIGEMECQPETKICVFRTSNDLCMGCLNDSIAISEDGAKLSGCSDQALWGNAHFGEDKAAGCRMSSYLSEYSASHLNSSTGLPTHLLECPTGNYKADALYYGESKYLDSDIFNVPASTVGDYSVHQQDSKITISSYSTKNTQRVAEMYQKEKQGQDYSPECLHKQENIESSQPGDYVDRTEIKLQAESLLNYQSLEQIVLSGKALPPALCSVEDISTSTVLKNVDILESPKSPEGFTSALCPPYTDSLQNTFLSTSFRVQESQAFCHQGFPSVACYSPDTSSSLNTSYSNAERHGPLNAAASNSPALASSLLQESQCDNSVIVDPQPCASETTSFSPMKESGCLPLSDTNSGSQRNSALDCSKIHELKTEAFHYERDVCEEPKDTASVQKAYLENIGKTLHHTLHSSLDLQEDQSTPQLSSSVDLDNFPNTNANNHHIIAHKVMKSKRESLMSEQLNISILNDSMSSKYLSGSSCLTLQEEPAPEIIKNENAVFTSQNSNRSKGDGQRPCLQSHSLSAPSITVISNFECASETSKVDLSVHSTSKSLQELNMSVEPPSPTEDDLHRAEGLSKLKTDNVVPVKYKPRFQKKSIQAQRSNYCDKRNCRESTQESHSSNPSSAHYPVAVAHKTGNPVDTETEKYSNNVSSAHRHSLSTHEDLRHQMEATDNKDAMHFSSSDINPYIHPWQQDECCKIGWKQYVFGSASDVSSNPPPLSLDNQAVMRCSSVDNGLNSQISPFRSHLSSYANARLLSSTISSTEDLQGWDVAREGFDSTHSDESGKPCTNVSHDELEATPENCISRCENGSQQPGKASMQVDEIVLLYPSESEKSSNKPQELLTCEQETQTEAPTRHRRQKRHRRSNTDISARNPEPSKDTFQQPSSWSSVQNLSLHLSQLLHNTSELLGNLSLQNVKDSEPSDHKAVEESSRTTVTDSCTQTTEDIGIQTDILGHPQNKDKERKINTNVESETMKSQEVNVIVKFVHTDTVALTKERMSEGMEHKMQGMLDKGSHDIPEDSFMPQPSLSRHSSSSSKVPIVPLHAPAVLSPVASSLGSRPESSDVVVSNPASSISLSPACYSQDRKPVGKADIPRIRDNSLLVDRASSPILTLSATPVSQQFTSGKSACSFKGSVGQRKRTASSETSFRGNGSAPQYDFGSWEPCVDSSSQTEVDSESTTSRESKEMYKMPENGFDNNAAREFSGASKQKHRFTIDTHTAVHTKRLYHSSSTLELSSHGEYLLDDHREAVPVERSFRQIRATRRARNFSGRIKYESPIRNSECSPTKKSLQRPLNETPECVPDSFSPQHQQTQRNQKHCPFPMSERSSVQDDGEDDNTGSDTESECNTEILLSENTSLVKTHRLRSYSLRDLPLHNKFSNWCGVQGGSRSSFTSLTRSAGDIHSQAERKTVNTRASGAEERSQLSERRAREIEGLRRERAQIMSGIHLEMNQHPLTVELTEAKLSYGIGETDAQLRILQSGVVEDLTSVPIKQRLYERHRKSIEMLRKQREEKLQCFRRSRSLSPQKHLSLLQTVETNQRDLDLPSRRREYLQQLRRDVVENTRIQEPKKSQHPSEIELLLRDYQRAREETKMEIARARDKLRERAEQEKRRIREQIHSQLQKAKTKLKTLVSTSTLCTDSTLSLSSGPTSGYNSSNTATYPTSTLGKQECQLTSPKDAEHTRDDARGRSSIRNHQLYVLEQLLKGSASETFPMTSSSVGRSGIPSPLASSHMYSHSLVVSPSVFPSSPTKGYEDLSKHVLANATAEVMAVCSNDLRNLYNGQATAGWKYQCVEKDVLVYYKAFSSSATKHGFLGAGMIDKPLSTVLCMLKDPSKRHLYDKTITTAQVHKKITSNIELVYVVSDVSLCYQKQPRDFCCISVEAKEENVCILAIQSVYEESMPRPCKDMVRGEILPSAWILEPDTVNGKDITKVIYMVQVDLGAPAIPARLLSSIAKRQPLVIARLGHFLAG